MEILSPGFTAPSSWHRPLHVGKGREGQLIATLASLRTDFQSSGPFDVHKLFKCRLVVPLRPPSEDRMLELPLGRLQHLYRCRVCHRVSVHGVPLSTALRTVLSKSVQRSSGIQSLKNGGGLVAGRGYHSLSYQLERTRLGKIFRSSRGVSNVLRQFTSRHPFKSSRLALVGGSVLCGGLGGLVFVNNRRPQTANCDGETEGTQTATSCSTELSLAQTPISELTLFQQLKLLIRFVYLSFLFSPAAVLYGASYLTANNELANLAWRYVYFVIQMAGPAFIKLGQWASTRRDLFSEDFCRALSKLHTRCNPHSWTDTDRMMCESFGENWKEDVVINDRDAIGSGCVAQVYQGYLRTGDGKENNEISDNDKSKKKNNVRTDLSYVPVAVKVLHPGVVEAMDRDIRLMKYVASWVDYLYPDVHWIALKECVDEFSFVMQQQVGGAV